MFQETTWLVFLEFYRLFICYNMKNQPILFKLNATIEIKFDICYSDFKFEPKSFYGWELSPKCFLNATQLIRDIEKE